MKIGKLLILGGAAYAGYIYYNFYSAGMNAASSAGHSSSGAAYSNPNTNLSNNASANNSGNTQLFSQSGGGGIGKVGYNANNALSQPETNSTTGYNSIDLLKSASKGDMEEVKKLLEKKVAVDSRDSERRTPLMHAAWNGHNQICAALLAAGANIDFKDREGFGPLEYAASRGLTETVKFLLSLTNRKDTQKHVAFATLISAVYNSRLDLLPTDGQQQSYINRLTVDGQSPIHISASNGYTPMVEALVKMGANVNLRGVREQTPLHWAAWNNQTDVIAFLIQNDAKIDLRDSAGNTPLLMGVEHNSINAVKLLIENGAEKNPKNKQGLTALVIATGKGYTQIANLLK